MFTDLVPFIATTFQENMSRIYAAYADKQILFKLDPRGSQHIYDFNSDFLWQISDPQHNRPIIPLAKTAQREIRYNFLTGEYDLPRTVNPDRGGARNDPHMKKTKLYLPRDSSCIPNVFSRSCGVAIGIDIRMTKIKSRYIFQNDIDENKKIWIKDNGAQTPTIRALPQSHLGAEQEVPVITVLACPRREAISHLFVYSAGEPSYFLNAIYIRQQWQLDKKHPIDVPIFYFHENTIKHLDPFEEFRLFCRYRSSQELSRELQKLLGKINLKRLWERALAYAHEGTATPTELAAFLALLIDQGEIVYASQLAAQLPIDLNQSVAGESLFMRAIKQNNTPLVLQFIESGVSPMLSDSDPLLYALEHNFNDIAHLIIERLGRELTTLQVSNAVKFLLQKSKNVPKVAMPLLHKLITHVEFAHLTDLSIDTDENSLLHYAILVDDSELFDHLFAAHLCLNKCDVRGYTPLMLAIKKRRYHFLEQFLQSKSLALNATEATTILDLLLEDRLFSFAEHLLQRDFEFLFAQLTYTEDLHSPLHLAFQHQQFSLAQLLIEKSADLYRYNRLQQRPLEVLVSVAPERVVEFKGLFERHRSNAQIPPFNPEIRTSLAADLCRLRSQWQQKFTRTNSSGIKEITQLLAGFQTGQENLICSKISGISAKRKGLRGLPHFWSHLSFGYKNGRKASVFAKPGRDPKIDRYYQWLATIDWQDVYARQKLIDDVAAYTPSLIG